MSARTRAEPEPRIDEHQARKEYRCDDPDHRGCTRRILRGDVYVQISYPPFSRPFSSPTWTIVRACSACRPPATAQVLACPIGAGGATCRRGSGHDGPHEYLEALF